jgi:hypothetical protein
MKTLLALVASAVLASTVQAAGPYHVLPAPAPAVAPVVTTYPAPVTVVQRPVIAADPSAPVVYRPAMVLTVPTTVYRPAVSVAPVPTTVYRPIPVAPAVTFYSPYTGWEVRVPGQPIRNFFRALIP